MSNTEYSLRDRQIMSIQRMLSFNSDKGTETVADSLDEQEITWKVLIMDARSTAIVSSVMRVNDLLKSNVTVHSVITQQRSPLPDVPAVYFVEPTEVNIDLIVQDLKEDKYSEFYINFTTTLKRDLLESFASKASATGKSDRIKQVYDQYLDFVVTEPEMFSLEIPDSYKIVNSPQSSEDAITELCDSIASGIFNAIVTIGTIPIIRAQRGGAAEMVAQKLEAKLRDYVNGTRSSSNTTTSFERLVLVLVDRNIDIASMFAHSWIYQCLVFDIFKLSRNTITMTTTNEQNEDVTKKMDIDPHDFFWTANSHLPFPDAVENVETELSNYKREAEEITKKTGVSNLTDLDPSGQNDTLQIQEAVKKLPELTAKKATIDTHMTVLAGLLKQLESKGLDSFFELEQSPDSSKTRQEFLTALKDGRTNNIEDKVRTYIIMYLTAQETLPSDFVQQVEKYLESVEYDTTALKYIYDLRHMFKLSSMALQNKSLETNTSANKNSQDGNASQLLSGLSNRLYGLTEGKIQGVGSLLSGIKKLLPEKKTIPITNIVEAIMDPLNSSKKNLNITNEYLYFDPRITRGSHEKLPKSQTYNKSLVFIIGGGNYFEYQNLQEWVHQHENNNKKVIYGSTDIVTPNDFLKEISGLKK
ncbi:Vesicle trafficking between the ER and Golgi [Kluyveromyces marxianus]|nr:Vesicle trafficking between the ER and Golgi [Kluyveromyces marxianus]KAG0685406.1 Vesicle trafficking between the ER and Golgi [Kluyveromyces marxianus]